MKSKSKFIVGILIFVILISSSSVFLYRNIINVVKSNLGSTTEAFQEEQFKVIWSSLNNLQLQSEKEVTKISVNIEKDILALSNEDLGQMNDDMTNGIFNDDLHSILSDNITNKNLNDINNHRNGIVVMTINGYIEDFNYRRACDAEDETLIRDWEHSLEKSYNKELEENAIDKLLNRTSGIIALESYDLVKNDNHIKIKELNYESLLQVFLNEGMEGLRNYQIFVPYYITDIGDIFGTPDIFHGNRVENNKIIVVQEFNLYDQIMSTQNNLFNDEQIQNVKSRYNELLRWFYIFGIVLVITLCTLIFCFCTVYNNIIANDYEHVYIENEAPRTDNEMQTDINIKDE